MYSDEEIDEWYDQMITFHPIFFCFSQPICVVLKIKVGYQFGGGVLSISFVSKIVFAAVRFIVCMSIKIKSARYLWRTVFRVK